MTAGPPPAAPGAPRRRRSFGRTVALLLLLIVAAAALAVQFRAALPLSDPLYADLERLWRRAVADAGGTLPGTPDLGSLNARLKAHGVSLGAPVFIRIFKREFELELWLLRDGRYHRFATYPICRWSGDLGPKLKQGDRQAPEGFYTVDEKALNPNSSWHRSFNLGYPNAFDRTHGRTGSLIMVHGGCGSIGCFAMTNAVIDEIWALVTAALRGGQPRFQVQVFPFRMTETNLARRRESTLAPFWQNLKAGHDLFEESQLPPKVSVCGGRYEFEPSARPEEANSTIEARCVTRPGKT